MHEHSLGSCAVGFDPASHGHLCLESNIGLSLHAFEHLHELLIGERLEIATWNGVRAVESDSLDTHARILAIIAVCEPSFHGRKRGKEELAVVLPEARRQLIDGQDVVHQSCEVAFTGLSLHILHVDITSCTSPFLTSHAAPVLKKGLIVPGSLSPHIASTRK